MNAPTTCLAQAHLRPTSGLTRLSRAALLSGLMVFAATSAMAVSFSETDLVSDLPGRAAIQDPNLVNAWGISFAPTRPFWISDNGTGLTTLYGAGGAITPLVVSIPAPSGAPAGTVAKPTGQVFSGASGVVLPGGGSAAFVFATEDGTLSGWGPANGSKAVLAVDNASKGLGSVYKGLEIASPQNGSARLYATDFRNGAVDVFDNHFNAVNLGASAFTDPNLPAGYAPFNIAKVGNQLAVSYAVQGASKMDDIGGPGHGIVDLYSLDGGLSKRLITGGALNSPWGMAIAPSSFGALGGSLLVGNFGDGTINAFDPTTGAFKGTLLDKNGQPIVINGLWALSTRDDLAGAQGRLYFTAGIDDEAHGLFGYIQAVPEPSTLWLMSVGLLLVGWVSHRHT